MSFLLEKFHILRGMLSFCWESRVKMMTTRCHTIHYIYDVLVWLLSFERGGERRFLVVEALVFEAWHPCRRRGFRNSTSATAILSLAFHRRLRVHSLLVATTSKHYSTMRYIMMVSRMQAQCNSEMMHVKMRTESARFTYFKIYRLMLTGFCCQHHCS